MVSEGEQPKSSWQSWVRSADRRRSADPDPGVPAAPPPAAAPPDLTGAGEPLFDPAPDLGRADLVFDPIDGPLVPADARGAQDPWQESDAGGWHPDGEAGDDGEFVPTAPLLPAIAGRVEALTGMLRAISHSLDGLSAGTDIYRSTVVDRIDQFADSVLEQGRRSEQTLDEYRRGSERTITELRRSVTEQAEAASLLLGRVEEIATDVATLAATPVTGAAAVAAAAAAPAPEVDLSPITESLEVILDRQDVIQRLLGELEVPAPVTGIEPGAAADVDLEPLLSRVGDIHALLEVVVDTMPGSEEGSGTDVAAALADIRAALDVAGRRGRAAAAAPTAPAFDDAAVGSIADAVVARLDLDALAALVAEHLSATFEVVTDEPVDDAGRRNRRK